MPKPGYLKRLWGAWITGAGAMLLVEHLYRFGFELHDFPWGHEWLGALMVAGGVALTAWKEK